VILFAFLQQMCVGGCVTATNNVTDVPQLLQDHLVFPFFSAGATFSTAFRTGVGVFFVVLMSLWAVCFVRIKMSPSFYDISHVVCLGSAFKVVGVDTDSVVAFVSDNWGIVVVRHEEGEPVCCTMLVCDVQLAVTIPSS
jgi:hypothetical protein